MAAKSKDPNKGHFIADPDFEDYQKNIDYSQYLKSNNPSGYSENNPDGSTYTTGPSVDFANFTKSRYDRDQVSLEDLPYLEDERAQNQGALSSLGASGAKFVAKTGLNVVGGIVGTVYGIGSSIANGDVSKIWDNSFNDKVEAIDNSLNDIFKVYKTSDYQNQNILQRAFLHPLQFTDDTSDALSFTAGAIVTELLSEGVATEALVPKALKYMKALSQGAEAAEATSELTSFGRNALRVAGDTGRVIKQLATGASYESIVEARKATMDLRNKMYSDWAKDHPNDDMPDYIKQDIDDRLSKAGLFTYLTNLALVGSTNMAEFPKIFGLGYKSSKAALGEVERDAATGLFKSGVKEFKDMSLLGKAATILKNPYEEGIKEEGLQDVISSTAQQYWDRKNDKDSNHEVARFISTVAHNLADTYTSKEGWNDIGMGMLIGGLGAPGRGALSIFGENSSLGKHGYDEVRDNNGNIVGKKRADIWTGGVVGAAKEHNEEVEKIANIVDALNQHTDLYSAMKNNYDFLVKNNQLEKDKQNALNANDIFNFNNAKDDQIHQYTSSRIKAGLYQDLLDNVESMKKISPDEFYKNFRGEEAADKTTDIEKTRFQQKSIQEFLQKAENTNEAIKIADRVYRGDNEDLRDALVHSIAASKNLDVREKFINQSLSDLSGGFISNLNLRHDDTGEVEKQLLENFINNNPTDATLNGDQISKLLDDSRKLRYKRQSYLDLYNHLFTEEGQRKFEQYQKDREQEVIDKQNEEAQKKADKEEEDLKKKNNKETVTKAKKNTAPSRQAAEGGGLTINMDEELERDDESTSPSTSPIEASESTETTPEVSNTTEEQNTPTEVNNEPIEELTPEENAIVKVEDNKEVKSNRELVTTSNSNLTKQSSLEHYQDLTNDIQLVDLDTKRTLGNTIAYLGIDKITLARKAGDNVVALKTFDVFDEDGNIEINKFVDPKLFSQNHYSVGTKLTLDVPTFNEMSEERGLQNYDETDYNNNIDKVGEFPIAIRNSDNKIIGYLPTQSNINRLVLEEFRDQALKDNLALRNFIFNNQGSKFNSTITSKSPGSIIANKFEVQKSIFDALGDGTKIADKVKIGIVKVPKGLAATIKDIYVDNSQTPFKDGEIINGNKLQNGVIYSILPSSRKESYVVYPLRTNTIGINNARTIVEAIKIFAKGKNLNKKEKESINNIKEFNFKNFKELNEFVNRIMYATSDVEAPTNTIFKIHKGTLYLSGLEEDKYSLVDIAEDKKTRDELADKLANRYFSIGLQDLNTNKSYISYHLNDEGDTIIEKENKSYQSYLNDEKALTSNIKGVHISGNEYAFTAQPVIGISNTIQRVNNQLTNSSASKIYDISKLKSATSREEFGELLRDMTNTRQGQHGQYDFDPTEAKLGISGLNPIIGNYFKYRDSEPRVVEEMNKFLDRLDEYNMSQFSKKENITDAEELPPNELPEETTPPIQEKKEEAKDEGQIVEKPKRMTKTKLNIDPNKLKGKSLEDINPEYLDKSQVKSGEDLMKKCL